MAGNKINPCQYLTVALYTLFVSIIVAKWDSYRTCYAPIQVFLLFTAIWTICFEIVLILQGREGVTRRAKKVINIVIFWVLTPSSFYNGIQGIVWIVENNNESPNCYPGYTPASMILVWIVYQNIISLMFLLIIIAKLIGRIRIWLYRRRMTSWAFETNDPNLRQMLLDAAQGDGHNLDRVGVSPEELKKLESRRHSVATADGTTDNGYETSCSICLTDYENDEELVVLPLCGHVYHPNCIKGWLVRDPLCPMCRANVKSNLGLVDQAPQQQQYTAITINTN